MFRVYIEGSPDHWWVTTSKATLPTVGVLNWRVTRSLVSYDNYPAIFDSNWVIEGSPDHWWVTTLPCSSIMSSKYIEGSPDHWWVTTRRTSINLHFHYWRVTRSLVSYDYWMDELNESLIDWRVTRSLVSYDLLQSLNLMLLKLKGHQIIGELRPVYNLCLVEPPLLKGHQIIGELRL